MVTTGCKLWFMELTINILELLQGMLRNKGLIHQDVTIYSLWLELDCVLLTAVHLTMDTFIIQLGIFHYGHSEVWMSQN